MRKSIGNFDEEGTNHGIQSLADPPRHQPPDSSEGRAAGAALPFMPSGAMAAAGPAAGGSITVGSAVDIINFDPYAQTINSLILLKNLNAWLIDYDENLRPVPHGAREFPDRAGSHQRHSKDQAKRDIPLWKEDDGR